MSFNLLNKRLALCDGPGKWLQWVKEPMLKHIPLYEVFEQNAGAPHIAFDSSMMCTPFHMEPA